MHNFPIKTKNEEKRWTNQHYINVFKHTILDGLDVTKQEFTGTISKATEVSQIVQTEGALDFEDVVIHNDKFNKYNYQGQSKYYKQLLIFFSCFSFHS